MGDRDLPVFSDVPVDSKRSRIGVGLTAYGDLAPSAFNRVMAVRIDCAG